MASANLDLVRSIYAGWERGDFGSTQWAHPEIEFVVAEGPSPGTWKGLAATAEGSRDFLDAWVDYRTEAEKYRELDGERVLVFFHRSGRGKTSGAEVMAEGAALFNMRDGKVTRFIQYWDRDHALADLGLAPEGDSPAS